MVQQKSAWLTAEEAAEYLKVKRRTLLLWTRQGKVKGHPLSGIKRHRWRYLYPDLDDILTGPSVALHTKGVQ
jgi:excisionase family DNA binding protein